ncbi:MAG: 4-hydroxythreonine-4-phosphate dehydrogenase PdxA [Cytophagales bacterium]|nr:4-hydroxythreonine-4-phosphate dehydrogenase PdxA [Cytophagales bacterium]
MRRLRLGISMGEPHGVGPELILRSIYENPFLKEIDIVLYGYPNVFSFHHNHLVKGKKTPWKEIRSIHDIPKNRREHSLYLINTATAKWGYKPGNSDRESALEAFSALKTSASDLIQKNIQALVTAPLEKKNVQQIFPDFTGHTGYLSQYFPQKTTLMFMVHKNLRIALATEHIPIQKISKSLSAEIFEKKLRTMYESLQKDFGIPQPKIAILGLNPHAGEHGLLGKEEQKYLIPVSEQFKVETQGFIRGPFSADGFFGSAAWKDYDGILSPYHDQGMIPFKLLTQLEGVNYTAGLPVIRTSPAHGTASSLLGTKKARPEAMKEAIKLALELVQNRDHPKHKTSDKTI